MVAVARGWRKGDSINVCSTAHSGKIIVSQSGVPVGSYGDGIKLMFPKTALWFGSTGEEKMS